MAKVLAIAWHHHHCRRARVALFYQRRFARAFSVDSGSPVQEVWLAPRHEGTSKFLLSATLHHEQSPALKRCCGVGMVHYFVLCLVVLHSAFCDALTFATLAFRIAQLSSVLLVSSLHPYLLLGSLWLVVDVYESGHDAARRAATRSEADPVATRPLPSSQTIHDHDNPFPELNDCDDDYDHLTSFIAEGIGEDDESEDGDDDVGNWPALESYALEHFSLSEYFSEKVDSHQMLLDDKEYSASLPASTRSPLARLDSSTCLNIIADSLVRSLRM
ncbi:hypothetical protein BDZ89DRAFT_1135393 [Hymenopellis radicata]|nr:hypothetical protein BDZ89DRAFT_1135393 [Hymenopellis radicata]